MNESTHIENRIAETLAGPLRSLDETAQRQGTQSDLVFSGAKRPLAAWLLAKAFSHADLTPGGPAKVLVVVPDGARAEELATDLKRLLGEELTSEGGTETGRRSGPMVSVLPDPEALPYSDISQDPAADQELCGTLFRLAQGMTGPLVVASAMALARKVIPMDAFDGLCDLLGPGQSLDRDALAAQLVAAGYRRMPLVDEPGCFAIRGGIVDLYTPAMGRPVRLELSGDVVETIRYFDPVTQRSQEECSEVSIHPVRQALVTDKEGIRPKLVAAAEATGCPSSQVRHVTEAMATGMDFYGSEALLPAFHDHLDSVDVYLPKGIPLFIEDEPQVEAALARLAQHLTEGYRHFVASGRLTFPAEQFYSQAESVADLLVLRDTTNRALRWTTSDSPSGGAGLAGLDATDMAELTAQVRRAAAEAGAEVFAPLATQLRRWSSDGWRVGLLSPDARAAERMASFLKGYGITVDLFPGSARSKDGGSEAPGAAVHRRTLVDRLEPGRVVVSWGRISAGFSWPQGKLALVSEAELFGSAARRKHATRAAGRELEDLGQLKPGDYVVHVEHGIAEFVGFQKMAPDGHGGAAGGGGQKEFLVLRYAAGDRLAGGLRLFGEYDPRPPPVTLDSLEEPLQGSFFDCNETVEIDQQLSPLFPQVPSDLRSEHLGVDSVEDAVEPHQDGRPAPLDVEFQQVGKILSLQPLRQELFRRHAVLRLPEPGLVGR